jgi:DNA-binding FadR family transcriptional regulator
LKGAEFSIDRTASGTLVGKVVDELRRRIADGTLRPGDKLPSRDALAKKLGVSEFVVRRAFAELDTVGLPEEKKAHLRTYAELLSGRKK